MPGMEIPTRDQIERMPDGEQSQLVGWLDTEKRHAERCLADAKAAAEAKRREAAAKDAEVEALGYRVKQIVGALGVLAGVKQKGGGS